jgi:hypothetical protein
MERKSVERRTFLKGGAAAVGLLGGASSELSTGGDQALADAPASGLPQQIQAAIERFRAAIPPNFDHDYVEKAVIPFFSHEHLRGSAADVANDGRRFQQRECATLRSLGPYHPRLAADA